MSNNGFQPPGSSYPPGYGPPGGHPPGGGYPQPTPMPGMPNMPRPGIPPLGPRRSGKALPIAVAAGLAVGVFLGLIVVKGTGSASADEVAVTDSDGDAGAEVATNGGADAGSAVATASLDAAAKVASSGDAKTTAVASSPDAAVAVSPPTTPDRPQTPTITTATLRIKFRPANAPSKEGFSLTIDDLPVSGESHVITLTNGMKKIAVVAQAKGYKSYKRKYTIREDQVITVRLSRKGSGGTKRPPGNGPGSIIDL